MTEPIDQLGPVDYLVVEFPGSNFNGEILPELVDLTQRGIVRVLDLVLIKKEEDGSFEAFEFDDIEDGVLGDLRELERELADVLSAEDVASVAEALEPGSTAGLLVYENLWAAPFASAVRRSGGQLIANGRIPVQALLAAERSRSEKQPTRKKEPDMLGRRRIGRPAVIAPVARTTATVATAAVAVHGVRRRGDRREDRRDDRRDRRF